MFGDVGSVTVGGTPSTSVPQYWGGAIPWMASGDVHGRVIDDVPTRISRLGLRHSNAMMVDPPSVAVALAGQGRTRGTAAYVRCALCTNQSVALLKGNPGKLDTEYLLHNLSFRYSELRSRSAGGGRAGLTKTILEQLPLPLPTVREQSKIADVLSTMDRAIEQTEALIAKQQRIKTGLMQDLLTRGIDEHGNLRSEQTHEFKDSSLGRIPAGWEVKALSEIGWFTNGINKSKEDFGFGTLFVNIADVYPDHLDVLSLGRLNASDAEATRYGLNIGDILIDRSSVKLEGVGYPTVFEGHNETVVFCGFIIRFRPRVGINSRFLCLQMRDDPFRIEVFKVATRSANVNVNQESLAELRIKIPTVDEQNRIVSFEAAIDKEHQNLRTQLVKLASLKTALMQDLLTGKKRVNPLLEQAAKD